VKHATPLLCAALLTLQMPANAAPQSTVARAAEAESATGPVPLARLTSAPSVTIRNHLLSVKIYLPDSKSGFYRGVRFDWAGIIGSLTYGGNDFFVPWFKAVSPTVRDYTYENGMVVNSANNATGPAEEFNGDGGALGYEETPVNGVFLKVGVGLLRRPDDSSYDRFRPYPIVDAGHRKVDLYRHQVVFIQEIRSVALQYGYRYTKTLRVDQTRPVMWIEHTLKNTGARSITTTVSNHNFLNVNDLGTTSSMTFEAPFVLIPERTPDASLALIHAQQIVFRASPAVGQLVSTTLSGYGPTSADNSFCITDRDLKVGVRISGNRPLSHLLFWSIHPVISIEPFVKFTIAAGQSFTWAYRYEFSSGSTSCGTRPATDG
jgi:hypothetical protein